MSRRRDGRLRWPTSAAYGAIAAGWAAPGRRHRGRPSHGGYLLVTGLVALFRWAQCAWGWRRGEQAEGAGTLNGLRAAVRAELGDEVTYVRLSGVHRQGQLAGNRQRGQVGRPVAEHPHRALAQRIY